MFAHRIVVVTIILQALVMAVLVGTTLVHRSRSSRSISCRGDEASRAGSHWPPSSRWRSASFANARLVITLGMRRIVTLDLYAAVLTISVPGAGPRSLLVSGLPSGDRQPLPCFMLWLHQPFLA
jgi:DHA1 family bicyclomycin/chloramphenicol resistance-like MFS transporter